MGNQLDELKGPKMEEGRDVNVIAKQLPIESDLADKFMVFLPVLIGIGISVFAILIEEYLVAIAGVIPIIWIVWKIKNIEAFFQQIQQRLQQSASTVDNFQEKRVRQLENAARLLERSEDLDRTIFSDIAKMRSGGMMTQDRVAADEQINSIASRLNVAVERYPELKSQNTIRDVLQQNAYTQSEITAAREKYNDDVMRWNNEIQKFPYKKYVAAKNGFTTRIPFAASAEVKARSKEVFF